MSIPRRTQSPLSSPPLSTLVITLTFSCFSLSANVPTVAPPFPPTSDATASHHGSDRLPRGRRHHCRGVTPLPRRRRVRRHADLPRHLFVQLDAVDAPALLRAVGALFPRQRCRAHARLHHVVDQRARHARHEGRGRDGEPRRPPVRARHLPSRRPRGLVGGRPAGRRPPHRHRGGVRDDGRRRGGHPPVGLNDARAVARLDPRLVPRRPVQRHGVGGRGGGPRLVGRGHRLGGDADGGECGDGAADGHSAV
ncbi:hypothetical protein BU14_2867s0001 [Porphyra umbilicalis]|uniref:Uncharacterized protein n=1 Tax=Porphyra umbilicalis TaxID=2786 RepID=A0A1X6NIF3_PORUM|nr:hypothetical protein BU14_2867s0001 [Porphyra umbilicalis]|eukprot:OSX68398.1 hypothetical protein BU14_2867s0001 [Porphyra umbilicalis]